jgi:archaellum component FlaC
VWFRDDGQTGDVNPLQNTLSRRRDNSLASTMLVQFEAMQERVVHLESTLGQVDSKLGQVDNKFGQVVNQLGQHDHKLGQFNNKLGQQDSEILKVKSKVRSAGMEILSEMVISGLVVLATVIVIAAVRKATRNNE